MTSLLQINGLVAGYGDFQALFGIDIEVPRGEVLALIGSNGAGKSTLLKSIVGFVSCKPGMVLFKDRAIGGMTPDHIALLGVALVPEGRRLFRSLTVEENIRIGGEHTRKGYWTLDRVYDLFPALRSRRHHLGNELSGGQQQMVAIARALMSNPELILFDEISLGLAPIVIKDIYAAMPQIVATGVGVILVEQDVSRALSYANKFVCLQEGRVSLSGAPADHCRSEIVEAYFGVRH